MSTITKKNMGSDNRRLAVTRSVAAMPVRNADRTWIAAAQLLINAMAGREFAHVEAFAQAMQELKPLARSLILRHALEGGRIVFSSEGMEISVLVRYGGHDGDEDLTTPAVEVLSPLSGDAAMSLTFITMAPIDDPFITQFHGKCVGGIVAVTVTVEDALPAQ